MFGRGQKYRIPQHLTPAALGLSEYKDPVTQAHVRLKDGREFVVGIWYPDRIWAIHGYTHLPFSGSDIEAVYQTEDDKHGSLDAKFMMLDEWAIGQVFSPRRWRLQFRKIMNSRGAKR